MAREHEFVLPSGVKCKVRSLKGKDQGTITKQDKVGDVTVFNKMLSDCILALGDKTLVTEKDVSRMLINDRKFALVELRQFSLRYKEIFEFDYEWPVEKSGKKEVSKHKIQFTDDNFPAKPYAWVAKKIAETSEEDMEIVKSNGDKFPVMYESYKDMLENERTMIFETEDGDQIEWQCATGDDETAWANVSKSQLDVNVTLKMKNPKLLLSTKEGGVAKVKYNIEEADIIDVEAFRKITKETEGDIDTFLTIKHPNNDSVRERIDLVGTVDFFFPSQAI